jgi:predicted nucleic acid-binding protein
VVRRAIADTSVFTGSEGQRFEPIPVDEAVSEAWALLVSRLRALGRKAPINDSWIAATAIAVGVPVVTQDADYDQMPGVEVIRL